MSTIRQLAEQAQKLGVSVKYRVRTDGGVLVTKLGTKTFKGASGNKALRTFMGEVLSQAREKQLKKITISANVADADFRDKFSQLQKEWRKATGKKVGKGKLSLRTAKKALKYESREEILRKASQAIRKELGLAYDKNVDALLERIARLGFISNVLHPYVQYINYEISEKRNLFKDEWIPVMNNLCYDIEHLASARNLTVQDAKEWAKNMHEVMK